MVSSGEPTRALRPVSTAELERRWRLARMAMDTAGVEVLVVRQADDWLGGYVKWLTDVPAVNGYGTTVLFFREGPMTLVQVGPFGASRDGAADPEARGVGQVRMTAPFASAAYTAGYEPEQADRVLRERGLRHIGVLTPGYMPSALIAALGGEPADRRRIVDLSDAIDAVKAVKSAEEQAFLRESAALQDDLFALALDILRPGIRDIDLTAALVGESLRRGSEQGIFNFGSAPLGEPAVFRRRHFQGRTMAAGDHLTLLIENNGPGGYYTELARTIVLGDAPRALERALGDAAAAQDNAVSLCRPGVLARDVAEGHNAFMQMLGRPQENRLFGHGQGYDLVERPLLRFDETMPLADGMCLAVHPGFRADGCYVNQCDNFMLSAAGTQRLHRTERRIFCV